MREFANFIAFMFKTDYFSNVILCITPHSCAWGWEEPEDRTVEHHA